MNVLAAICKHGVFMTSLPVTDEIRTIYTKLPPSTEWS